MRINNPMDMGGNPLLTGITVSDMLSGSGTKLDPLKFKGLSAVDSTGQSVSEAVTSFKAGEGVTFSDDGTAIVVSADGVGANDSRITVTQDGVERGSFTLNQAGDASIDIKLRKHALETLKSVPGTWSEADVDRVFQWAGEDESKYVRGNIYRVESRTVSYHGPDPDVIVVSGFTDNYSVMNGRYEKFQEKTQLKDGKIQSVYVNSSNSGGECRLLYDVERGEYQISDWTVLGAVASNPGGTDDPITLSHLQSSGEFVLKPTKGRASLSFESPILDRTETILDAFLFNPASEGKVRTVNGVSPAEGNVQLKVSDLDGSDQLADAKSLSDHMKDGVLHVTADERKAWNAKLDASAISGLQNADQVNALIAEKMVSVVRFRGIKNAVSELDASSSEVGDLWLVMVDKERGVFDEYVCVEDTSPEGVTVKGYDLIGSFGSEYIGGMIDALSLELGELSEILDGFSPNSTVKAAMDADAQALSSHVGDKVSHITAAERASWTAKAEVSQIPVKVSQLNNDYEYQTKDDLTALDNAKLDRPVSAGEDGQVLTCLKGEPVWSKVTVDPVSTSLSCRMVAIQPGWYDAQTKRVTIPNTTFPAIGLKAPAAAGGHYYPLEKDDCAIGESSVTVDMSRYLTYENTQDFAEGWAVYMASGCQNGKVIEIIDTPMFFTPEDKDRIFQWDGNTNGTYIKGHFYRVDANGDATDCTPQIFRAVEPIEVLSTNLTVEPFQCYEWTVKSPVTMNMEGWSTSGEEWSTIYIRVQASGSVEGGPGITFVHPLVKGKMNFCQIKGYRGKLRVFVLDSYDE